MAVEKSYTRLGIFVALALAVIVATGLFFVERMRRRAVIELVTYVTENVSGLDISSPVRFRGVPVGLCRIFRWIQAAKRSRSDSSCSRIG